MLDNTLFIAFENEGAMLGKWLKKDLNTHIDLINIHTIQRTLDDDSTWECIIEKEYHPFSGRTSVWSQASMTFANFTHDLNAQNLVRNACKMGRWDNVVIIAPAFTMVAVDAFSLGVPWLCSVILPIINNITVATVLPPNKIEHTYIDAAKGLYNIKHVSEKIQIEQAEFDWSSYGIPNTSSDQISHDIHDAFCHCINMVRKWIEE